MKKKNPVDTKSPDTFQITMYKLFDWILKSKVLLMSIFVPVILALTGLFVWDRMSELGAQERKQSLAEIDLVFNSEKKVADEKIKELKVKLDEVESDKAKKSEKDKIQKEIDAVEADHSQSLAKYLSFMRDNLGTTEGKLAGVLAANIELGYNRTKKAKMIFDELFSADPTGPFYDVQVRFLYSNLLEEVGEFDEAIKQIDKALVGATDSLKPKILFSKGRILLGLGKKVEADGVFEKLVLSFSDSPEAKKIPAIRMILQ